MTCHDSAAYGTHMNTNKGATMNDVRKPVTCLVCLGSGMLDNGHPDPQEREDGECHACNGDGEVWPCEHDDGEIAVDEITYRDDDRTVQTVRVCAEHSADLRMADVAEPCILDVEPLS